MSPVTLPHALLLLLTEFAAGSLLWLLVIELRATAPHGYMKMAAGIATGAVLLAALAAAALPARASAGPYPLAATFFRPLKVALLITLLLSLASSALVWRKPGRPALAISAAASASGLAALALLAAIAQEPTWGFAGLFLTALAGGLALGGVTLAMALGHWYLVTPRLPEAPLVELNLWLLTIIAGQTVLLMVNVAVPVRQVLLPLALLQNPAFWLRVLVGLGLALFLVLLAWQSSRIRGMMSATGLLYLATGAVLAGQALACALLFASAVPT